MAFAAALSTHPVSSLATGEIVGRLLETVGPGADLLIVLATPGHAGALDDITTTARRLLEPRALLAAVTTGLGVGEEWVAPGPGLAAWSGSCGPLQALRPGVRSPQGSRDRGGAWPAGGDAAGALALTVPGARPLRPPAGSPDLPVVAGAVRGPVSIDGRAPGSGPAGVVFGRRSGFAMVDVLGLRPLGPPLTVTRSERAMLYELDGRTALAQLVDLARDGLPAAEMPAVARGLHLAMPGRGPLAVLGADRTNGALAVAGPVGTGDVVQFAVPDPAGLRDGLRRALDVVPAGAIVLTSSAGGRHIGLGPGAPPHDGDPPAGDGPNWFEAPTPLPAATLVCAVAPDDERVAGRSVAPLTTATVAHFPPDRSRHDRAG